MEFSQKDLLPSLEATQAGDLDGLPFGVIRMDCEGRVLAYNRYESAATGLSRERVLGRHFFSEIGPCMDNARVAGRFAEATELDVELDYVFALRLQPENVRLRLLKSGSAESSYLLVKRTGDGQR